MAGRLCGWLARCVASQLSNQLTDRPKSFLTIGGKPFTTESCFSGNIYFTNSFDVEVFIEVARIDGSMRKVIVRESQGSPASIAVNPIKRFS